MPKAIKDPIERVSRFLCRRDNLPENTRNGGKPIWLSFEDEARKLLSQLAEGDELPGGLVLKRE